MTAIALPTLRAGLRRGVITFANALRSPSDLTFWFGGIVSTVLVLWFLRDSTIDGAGLSVSQFIFPGLLTIQIMIAAGWGLAMTLSTEREDGTLLRAKALPNGVTTYVAGLSVRTLLETGIALTIVIVPSVLIVDGLFDRGPVALLGVVLLLVGFLALLPVGFIVGALVRNPRAVSGWGLLVLGAVVMVSGIFLPLNVLPGWLQVVGQLLPLYWLGHGLRSVLLPEGFAVVEVGESWRLLEAFGVLGAWAVVGMLVTPPLLRRMSRRESASLLERSRQKALQRV